MVRNFKGIILSLALLYILGNAFLYFQQERFIFNPSPIEETTTFRWGDEVFIEVEEGIELHGLYHSSPNSQGSILYFHGNKGNNKRCQRQAAMFDDYGMDVLLIDYRGYGKSDGRIENIEQLENDAVKAYDWLANKNPGLPIWAVGYSLGTGMASYLSSQRNISSLILIAPYTSIIDIKDSYLPIIPDFLLKYPLSNEHYLKEYNGEIAIFHGTDDKVIPYSNAEDLYSIDKENIKLNTLQGTGHRGAIFHRSVSEYLSHKLK